MLRVDLHLDGSYSSNHPNVTWGAYIIRINGIPVTASRIEITNRDLVKMNNVGGEVGSAMAGVTAITNILSRILLTTDKPFWCDLYIQYDYTGIYNFTKLAKVKFTPDEKKLGSCMYKNTMDDLIDGNPNIRFHFVKVKGHSGDKWNELVDKIANGSLTGEVEGVEILQKKFEGKTGA